jgi:DNA invertase Pin-like site-specific DNA recombinase
VSVSPEFERAFIVERVMAGLARARGKASSLGATTESEPYERDTVLSEVGRSANRASLMRLKDVRRRIEAGALVEASGEQIQRNGIDNSGR